MDLQLEKIITTTAFTFAVSPDGKRIAVSGERKVSVFSLPDLLKVESFQVKHTCSIAYLSDSKSMIIQNTTGRLFAWNGANVELVGKWPTSKWQEKPIFHSGNDCILYAGIDGIWMYKATTRSFAKIYTTSRDIRICRCDKDGIRCVALPGNKTEKKAEILCLDYEGTIWQQSQTEEDIMSSLFSPAWSDSDTIAISTPITEDFPLRLIYLLDLKGRVVAQEWIADAEDNGDFCYSNGMFVKASTVGAYAVTFWDAHNMQQVYTLDSEKLASYGMTTPLTFAFLCSDNRVLLGSWDKLLAFRIV